MNAKAPIPLPLCHIFSTKFTIWSEKIQLVNEHFFTEKGFNFRMHCGSKGNDIQVWANLVFLKLPMRKESIDWHLWGKGSHMDLPFVLTPVSYFQLTIDSPSIFCFQFFFLKILPFHHKNFTWFPSRYNDFCNLSAAHIQFKSVSQVALGSNWSENSGEWYILISFLISHLWDLWTCRLL